MYHQEKSTGDIIVDGFARGIASSPHTGIANMQGVNLQTETGEVMASFVRARSNQKPISGGTFTAGNSSSVVYQGTTSLLAGTWVQITASTITGITANSYYWMVPTQFPSTSSLYPYNFYLDVTIPSGIGLTGSATFNTVDMAAPIQNQGATEIYTDSTGITQTRYYVGDINGRVWVYDTQYTPIGVFWAGGIGWSIVSNNSDISTSYAIASGLAVLEGNLLLFTNSVTTPKQATIYYKKTSRLDATWAPATSTLQSYIYPHFAYVNHNNFCFFTDGEFIDQILPSSVSSGNAINIWTYASVVVSGVSTDTLNIGTSVGGYLLGGSFPIVGQSVYFYNSNGGSPGGYSNDTIYYIKSVNRANGTFQISSTVGGSALTGLSNSGTIYMNSFFPVFGGSNPSTIVTEALQLSANETAQCLVELGSNLLIGCQSNSVYNWNEVSISGGGSVTVVQFPESNISSFVQANNVAYAFAGNKGNIYNTNGSFVSGALTVPDYTAGIAGTPGSYIEPYFMWGGTTFMRGRIWFSLQDQTATKTGNDGGIWSFIPSAFDPTTGGETGSALRMETQNTYGTYNGMATIILPLVSQAAIGSQYFTAWTSDQSAGSAVYGIDASGTTPYTGGQTIIETDLIRFGEILGDQKGTPDNIEFTLSAPLAAGESVSILYRQNLTDAFATAGTIQYTGASATGQVGGFISPHTIENVLWLQFKIVLTSTASSPSFVRFVQLRIRPKK